MLQRFFFCLQSMLDWFLLYTIFLWETFLVLFSSSIFCKALYFSLMEMFTFFIIFHICSSALRCLAKIRILLFWTFEFWFVQIFLKFLREDIALLILQKSVFWFCHKVWKEKMNLVEKQLWTKNDQLPIVTINSFETVSNVKVFGFQKLVKHCQQKENSVILKANALST